MEFIPFAMPKPVPNYNIDNQKYRYLPHELTVANVHISTEPCEDVVHRLNAFCAGLLSRSSHHSGG